MTNGEKIKEIFPSTDSRLDERTGIMLVKWVDGVTKCFKADWWNAEYKEPTTPNDCETCIHNKGVLECDMYGCKYEPTENDLGVEDCVSRADVLKLMQDNWHTHNGDWAMQESMDDIRALPSVTPQEPTEKCTWIKYDYRTMCPKGHIDIDNLYWRIPKNMETLKYCPYCGKEIEVEE